MLGSQCKSFTGVLLSSKSGGENEKSSLFLLQEGLLYLYVFENTKITNEITM
jgi:hypothetical protein